MPTINQLVRQGRQNKTFKSKAPALGQRWNSLKKKETAQPLLNLTRAYFLNAELGFFGVIVPTRVQTPRF